MPEYINPNGHSVHLTGPDGRTIKVRSNQRIELPDYFDRYRARGFIQLLAEYKNTKSRMRVRKPAEIKSAILPKAAQTQPTARQSQKKARQNAINKARKIVRRRPVSGRINGRSLIVGRRIAADAAKLLKKNLSFDCFPVSNNIGIGILSYNRFDSLQRLIDSIQNNTDLRRTTVFVSDDGSTEPEICAYLGILDAHPNFVVLRNRQNLGVAGNSNRLIRCIARFKYGLLLNDDVEVLRQGWEEFYPEAMRHTGMHHFSFLQPGVYGASDGKLVPGGKFDLRVVQDKPHGAVLAFARDMLVKCGYFNEGFGRYGMEHVDWSMKPHEFGLQDRGFFDVEGSQNYFKVHRDASVVPDRARLLVEARKIFAQRTKQRLGPTERSQVPEISYVVPCRNTDRQAAIETVVNNIRAQRFPVVHIILVEQDRNTKLALESFKPVQYYLAQELNNPLFNKSKAFNLGVSNVTTTNVILHDADMVVPGAYTTKVAEILQNYESCHLGCTVLYTSPEAAKVINETGLISDTASCERVVGYFEGGSLACRVGAFWRVGGFNEDFWGYGCFAPGNLVNTERGYVPIEFIRSCDKLLTHIGNYQPQRQRVRDYVGPMLDIFIPGRLPIKGVTPEHPFLRQDIDGDYSWVPANELRIGDILGQTDILVDLSPSVAFEDVPDKSKNQFEIAQHRNTLSYLMGMYLAEGVIQTPRRLRTTYFFLHEHEEFLAEHIAKLVHRLNPNISVNYEYVKDACRHVVVSNSYLAKFIFAHAGKHKAVNKIVSSAYLDSLTDEALGHLLGGLLDGDGGHQFNSERRLIYHSSSFNLAFAVSSVMRKLGVAHSFGKRKGGGFENSKKWSYDLTVNREFEHLIQSVYEKPLFLGSNSCGKSQFGLICDIRVRHYNGPVYNFEVNQDRSYCVQGIYVHNCEDCEFYMRLAKNSRLYEDRKIDLLHLWHGRVPGWNKHHAENKKKEKRLNQIPMPIRIKDQYEQLRRNGYGDKL